MGRSLLCVVIACYFAANAKLSLGDEYKLNVEQKKLLVDTHNTLRGQVTPAATDMLKMSWDADLEKLARAYSTKCIYEHSSTPVTTKKFPEVGENLYVSTRKINNDILSRAVNKWFDENAYYDYTSETCQDGKVCGHYTQVAWAESYKVGCGITSCKTIDVLSDTWNNAALLVCYYGPAGNIISLFSSSPYNEGTSCSDCSKYDICESKLCSNATRDVSSYGDDGDKDDDDNGDDDASKPDDGPGSRSRKSATINIFALIACLLMFVYCC